ncbi:MAG: hypothetical protein KAG66_07195, partial [Methylococcales bacterium]|nr:hypothetical protein [Methylococcales bacterium]
VTGVRIWHEVELALQEDDPVAVLRRLDGVGVLAQLHPQLRWQEEAGVMWEKMPAFSPTSLWQIPTSDLTPIRLMLWLYPFSSAVQQTIVQRLCLRQHLADDLNATTALLNELHQCQTPSPSQIVAIIRPHVKRVRILFAAWLILKNQGHDVCATWVVAYQEKWKHEKTYLNGNDLLTLGVPAG